MKKFILKLLFAIKQWNTGDTKDTLKRDFLKPSVLIKTVNIPRKPKSWTQPVCQHPVMGTLHWTVFWIREWLDWLGQGHKPTERPRPRSPHLYLSILPADSDCQHPWSTQTKSLQNILLMRLWQVKVCKLPLVVSDWKMYSKQYTEKL